MREACAKYDFDINDLDLIPVRFGDIDVSATTEKGVVILNADLLKECDIKEIAGYCLHEFCHYLQQSSEPTQSANDGDYLANPFEQEGFQFQIKFIADNKGEEDADEYVEQVLDHHDKEGDERDELKKDLENKL